MRLRVVSQIIGRFMLVFAPILASPVLIGLYYSEPSHILAPFIYASIACLIAGFILKHGGKSSDPSVKEALIATVLGWSIATFLGGVPLLSEMSFINAVFESAAGLTTTGISMFLTPEELPNSILFWRSLMQWVGGLGILTFFIAVIRESGGISRRLFSAETHKTDPGSIRPSLRKSIIELWRVYGFITSVIIGTFVALGMTPFNAITHGFSTLSTGGFSTTSQSLGGFSPEIQAATIPFMFIGGVNFVLLYRFLRGEASALKNSELKMYMQIFIAMTGVFFLGYMGSSSALLDSAFQSAAIISSTGFGTASLLTLSTAIQVVIIAAMFAGGSVGSTAGGIKVFRLKALIELVKTRIRAYSLPETAVNEVKIDEEIMDRSTIRTISVLFFVWVVVVFAGTVSVLALDGVTFEAALSGAVSSAGNMGPVFMEGGQMVELSWMSKSIWILLMLAGRLEMLPLLAIFNRSFLPDSK
ncbi:TrkH family potassium uptake protein [Candidatus Nanohalobium constans]|uniref:Trk-type K+ transport system, membrane component n=1 Tax=Candidatus Nanohalobium constans TaxID=2565781 RepID=A0A5Q0UIB8_9ARCH|nr:TrkH family potassium uptake protein [Candidatus Nanohalobium constans]QGA80675.1 Trk-type K+ transport system, membrane component [Candidatus Nanohalobium constans]